VGAVVPEEIFEVGEVPGTTFHGREPIVGHTNSQGTWVGPRFCNSSGIEEEPTMPGERPVYGCVGADRLEARLLIEEVDGILVYICPKCRRELEKIDATLSRK
jgi:hypothetical protein